MARRAFIIYTADGERHPVAAPSLRTAVRDFDESKARIVAAVDTECLPKPSTKTPPFYAVFLTNARFTPPPLG